LAKVISNGGTACGPSGCSPLLTSATSSKGPVGGVGAKRLVSLPGSGAFWPGARNVTEWGSLVSSQLQRTFWPTATVALAGMYCSTAIWLWVGSLTPALMVMGSLSTAPSPTLLPSMHP
jgi:hypothetical protein